MCFLCVPLVAAYQITPHVCLQCQKLTCQDYFKVLTVPHYTLHYTRKTYGSTKLYRMSLYAVTLQLP